MPLHMSFMGDRMENLGYKIKKNLKKPETVRHQQGDRETFPVWSGDWVRSQDLKEE